MRTIIGNSGGLDSTYALWKLLSTTDDEVTVVLLNTDGLTDQVMQKFDVRSFNGRHSNAVRFQRVQAIVGWLSANVRPCTLVNVDVDETILLPGIDYPNNPNTAIVEWAVAKINAGEADKVIVTTERENDGYSNGGTITTRAPGATAARSRFVEKASRGEISFMLLDSGYHQGVALRELPQALIGLTHSCDVQGSEPCGVCFKCSKRKFFTEAIASGKTDEEIRAKVASKSELPNGRWRSMKYWIAEEVPTCRTPAMDKTWDVPSWPSSYKVP
jgi:7-cyano-7-deazaguanine synthase in queuosine biosynthesis